MKRLLRVLTGFVVLLLSSTEGWCLPPCPEKGVWNNCFGTYKSDDGTKYVGEWKDDQSHGQGTETYANGDKYVGQWKDGKYHGQGIKAYADGRVEKGEWENNKYVKIPSKKVGVAASAEQIEANDKKLSKADLKPIDHEKFYPDGYGPFPAVITLHTSGGYGISKNAIENFKSKTWTEKGYAVYAPNFFKKHEITNRTRMDTFNKYREDIEKDLLEIVKLMKTDSKINNRNIFAVGFSNGGFWASFLAGKAVINAGASHYGVWKGNMGREMTTTPADYFSKTSKPLLALHGEDDGTQRMRFVSLAWDQAIEQGGKITTHVFGGAGHAWDCKKCRKFDNWDAEVTQDSLNRTIQFFKNHQVK